MFNYLGLRFTRRSADCSSVAALFGHWPGLLTVSEPLEYSDHSAEKQQGDVRSTLATVLKSCRVTLQEQCAPRTPS
jgi:hypothetical protein